MPTYAEKIAWIKSQRQPSVKEFTAQFEPEPTYAEKIAWIKEQQPPTVVEEQHPSVSFADRMIAKQAADPEQAIRSLQQNNPNLEYKADGMRVLIRTPGQKDWRVLDPDTGFFSKDFRADVADVIPDIVQGTGEALATAGGAIAGSAAGPAGTVAGGMAAGGAAGGALEALKQKVFFPQDELNMGNVGIGAAFGAASPLLLGSGVGVKEVGKRGFKSALQEKGIIGGAVSHAMNRGAPKLASLSSGGRISADEFRYAAKNPEEIAKVSAAPLDYMVEEAKLLKQDAREATKKLYDKMEVFRTGKRKDIDVTAFPKPLLDHRFDLAGIVKEDPTILDNVKNLKHANTIVNRLLGDDPYATPLRSATQVANLGKNIKQTIKVVKKKDDVINQEILKPLIATRKAIDDALEVRYGEKYLNANKAYHDFKEIHKNITKKFGKTDSDVYTSAEKMLAEMAQEKGPINIKSDIFGKADDIFSTRLQKAYDRISTANKMAKPSRLALGMPGMHALAYGAVAGGATGAGTGSVNAGIGGGAAVLGLAAALSPAAWKFYLRKGYIAREAAKKFNIPGQVVKQSAWNLIDNKGGVK